MRTVVTNSVEETLTLGERLGRLLAPGDFVALVGELGAGKTHFVQGVARGLGIDPAVPVTSPTYTLLHEYRGRIPLYHFDLYRLGGVDDILELGFAEYFHGDGVCLVEWAERLGNELPPEQLTIFLAHRGDDRRAIVFEPHGARYAELLERLLPATG